MHKKEKIHPLHYNTFYWSFTVVLIGILSPLPAKQSFICPLFATSGGRGVFCYAEMLLKFMELFASGNQDEPTYVQNLHNTYSCFSLIF